jgi:hypothetical protein
LKADFIASLPYAAVRLPLIYFGRFERRTLVCHEVAQTGKCYHIFRGREARAYRIETN